ncbi:HsdM family class I SAM-dependent methyltransferase [Streptomyces longwoodensis]|uniref:class I SAM-dependent DNA methyltransferase n=1 Tax=Streptomyces longwoodensis TaxID=68231 RepID=UPI00225731BF|nr:class I SAM-dependent DNA methyltransferase [Streptomyces longwoodensis]MCX4995920.1 type I restriction-modification system subunit M [Streptomyces longwoodensis]
MTTSATDRSGELPASRGATDARTLVNKLWSYCNVLRDDGVSVLDYVEQLTFLVFLKMAHEQMHRRIKPIDILGFDAWQELLDLEGVELEVRYTEILGELARRQGILGRIFQKSQNRIQDPAKLKRLIRELIGKEVWAGTNTDVKGDAYEELLAKGAEDVKSGAGQYFTPRALIEAMVDCTQPSVHDTVMDPACGTGGFLLKAFEYIQHHLPVNASQEEKDRLTSGAIQGNELVDGTARLAAMNMVLHGIALSSSKTSPITVGDALAEPPKQHASLVLANPPFGKKSSITVISDEEGDSERKELTYSRRDFWATTTNKQLNFVQHIFTLLETYGRAAVVVPDNVLFEGGIGEIVRRRLLHQCDVHTLLRLPTGIFYAGGVKANVLFFEKPPPRQDGKPLTKTLWVYDFRTNQRFTLKQNPLRRHHLDDFVQAYRPGKPRNERSETPAFKPYPVEELLGRDKISLDLFASLKDESLEVTDLSIEPHALARQIVDELEAALSEFASVAEALRPTGPVTSPLPDE